MKIFYGANNILVHLDDGGRRLIPKEYLSVYFQIDGEKIKEKHIKKFLNLK
jgi:hypothetical protein